MAGVRDQRAGARRIRREPVSCITTQPHREGIVKNCLWCNRSFAAKTVGAHAKKFCQPSCKDQFHRAARLWAEKAIARGKLSVADIRAAQAWYTTGEGEN